MGLFMADTKLEANHTKDFLLLHRVKKLFCLLFYYIHYTSNETCGYLMLEALCEARVVLNWYDFACKFQIPDFIKICLADLQVQCATKVHLFIFHSVTAHYSQKLQMFRVHNALHSKEITDYLMCFLKILTSFSWGVNSIMCNKNNFHHSCWVKNNRFEIIFLFKIHSFLKTHSV